MECRHNGRWLDYLFYERRSRISPNGGMERSPFVLCRKVFSAEETGIERPCPGTYHRGGNTEGRQDDRNPRVTGMVQDDPQFDYGDQRSHDRRPEAYKEKDAGQRAQELRDH
jgi:hypothetical protein